MLRFGVIMILYAVIALWRQWAPSPPSGIPRPEGGAGLLRDVPHHDRRLLPGIRGVTSESHGVAPGNGSRRHLCVIGLFGSRLPIALIVGYPLHGLWDLLHELQAQGAFSAFEPGQLTSIRSPTALLCGLRRLHRGYFYTRRAD